MKKNYKLKIPKQSLLLIFTGFSFFGCNQTEQFIDLNNNSKMDPYEDPNISATQITTMIQKLISLDKERITQIDIILWTQIPPCLQPTQKTTHA